MKKIISFASIGILLIVTIILLTFCKKDDGPTTPAFVVTATTVQIQGGGDGLQFTAKCTNNNVKMAKVIITDPTQSPPFLYNLNGTIYSKDESFALQATGVAYNKKIGKWKFEFIGNRTEDDVSFYETTTLDVK
jgi:hypothetical protein